MSNTKSCSRCHNSVDILYKHLQCSVIAIFSNSMTLYCDWCRSGNATDIHIHHHDLEHGIPPDNDNQLFSRLCYEVLQAGLSWDIILKRRDGLHAVWHDFDVVVTAALGAGVALSSGIGAPPRIHASIAAICACGIRPLGGIIRLWSSYLMASSNMDLPGSAALIREPRGPPFLINAGESSRS
jgi:hypothetical protein